MSDNLHYLMTQSEIAKLSDRSQSSIHYILKGDRTPSIETALKLEKATGICREAWLFPERHYNPYMPFNNGAACMTCRNRRMRVKKSLEMAEKYFELTQDFQAMTEIHRTYTGNKDVVFIWREVTDNGLKLLGCSKGIDQALLPELIRKNKFKQLHTWAKESNTLVCSHFPYDIPQDWVDEINILFHFKLKSLSAISKNGLYFSMYSNKLTIDWTDDGTKNVEKHVEHISKLWNENKRTNPK